MREPDAEAAIAAVVQLLWDTALRIEDGRMSLAERDLRRLQQELQDALAKGRAGRGDRPADAASCSRRSTAICRRSRRTCRTTPVDETTPVDPSQVLTGRDLQRMLDRARELARSGAQQQAREMLSQLQDMLENLRTARPGEMRSAAPARRSR